MMKKNGDIWTVHSYPKDGYARDEALQRFLTDRSRTVDRRMKVLFLGFVGVFALCVLMILAGFSWFVFGCIVGGAVLPIAGLLYLPPPRRPCPSCKTRMKKEYESVNAETARYGEFLVCHHCRRYAYTHRASRP
jgi:hypothetical protein